MLDGTYTTVGTRIDVAVDLLYRERLSKALAAQFEIRSQIGDGGFGVVYEAYDLRLGRSIAIKVLRHGLAASNLERFEHEARVVASLRHPNIVPVHFFGEGEGLVFLTMPLLSGRTLRDRLREGPLPHEQVSRILTEMSSALDAAHSAGIVHRDLKPENVFLEGSEERVVLLDFGIAKASHESGLTGSGAILGTPAYMSPEQFSGSSAVDPRTDLYALGIMGFEMLAGRPPFLGPTIPELMYQHLAERPDDTRLAKTGADTQLRALIGRLLEKEPARRLQSAAELRASLQALVAPVGPSIESTQRSTMAWLWIACLCGWPPALLRWTEPLIEVVDASRLSGRPPVVLGAIRTFSLIPFSVLAVLVTVVATVEVVRSLRRVPTGERSLATTVRGLMEGPFNPNEVLALTGLVGVTFFFGVLALPTFEVMAESVGARVPRTLSGSTHFLQLWFLPLITVLLVFRVVAWRTERNIRVVRLGARVLAAISGLVLWFVATTGL